MKKFRILALVMAVLMGLGLFVGCAGCTESEYDIHIGILAPTTGGVAMFGNSVLRGATLYIEQFNAQGGLQIGFTHIDEEGQSPLAIAGYRSLVDQGVTAILGSVTSAPTMAIVPLAFEDNMPMITASATHANVTVNPADGSVFTNMFRSCFIDPFQGETMADFVSDVLGASSAAVLYSHEIDYSRGLMEVFVETAEALGVEIVALERFANDANEFRGQLTNIAAASPDVLFIPAYVRHLLLIGPQSAEVAGLEDTILLGADGWAGITRDMADSSSLEGAYFLSGFSADMDDAMVQDFVASYRARWGSEPDMFAAQGFDAAKILIAAIEATLAEVEHDPSSEEFRLVLIDNLATTDIIGVTGRIYYDEFNNPQKTAIIQRVTDGRESFWGYREQGVASFTEVD